MQPQTPHTPIDRWKALLETRRLHIGFASERFQTLVWAIYCMSVAGRSHFSVARWARYSQNEGTSVVPGSQGRVAGGPRHMPRAITVTRAERPALRHPSTSPQERRAEDISAVVRSVVAAASHPTEGSAGSLRPVR